MEISVPTVQPECAEKVLYPILNADKLSIKQILKL